MFTNALSNIINYFFIFYFTYSIKNCFWMDYICRKKMFNIPLYQHKLIPIYDTNF